MVFAQTELLDFISSVEGFDPRRYSYLLGTRAPFLGGSSWRAVLLVCIECSRSPGSCLKHTSVLCGNKSVEVRGDGLALLDLQ